jgi:dTDP-4-dehydrorhamnose 3,5-epimerase
MVVSLPQFFNFSSLPTNIHNRTVICYDNLNRFQKEYQAMNCRTTTLPGLLILEPKVFGDDRGFFFESFNERAWNSVTGLDHRFVQHNHSRSARNVIRGLHYQINHPQGKLVRVISGEIFDVAVDIRRSSPTCGQWFGITLSAENKQQLWVPEGFAHGFCVTSDHAELLYLATDYWAPDFERCIAWNDPDLAISWPLNGEPLLSAKDRTGTRLAEAEPFD